jgi:hypothetical protein
MFTDSNKPMQAMGNRSRAARDSANAAIRATRAIEHPVNQLASRQALAAWHAAQVANEAARQEDKNSRAAREEWKERIRASLADVKSSLTFTHNAPRLDLDQARFATAIQQTGRGDTAWPGRIGSPASSRMSSPRSGRIDPAWPELVAVALDQAKTRERPACVSEISNHRAEAILAQSVPAASSSHRSPDTEPFSLAATRADTGPIPSEISAPATWAERRRPQPAQILSREYPELIGQITDLEAATTSETAGIEAKPSRAARIEVIGSTPGARLDQTERRAEVRSRVRQDAAQVSAGVSWEISAAPATVARYGALNSLHVLPLDEAARRAADGTQTLDSTPVSQSPSRGFAFRNLDPETGDWLEKADRVSSPGNRVMPSSSPGTGTQRPILEQTKATRIQMPEAQAAKFEFAASPLRAGLLGVSEPARAAKTEFTPLPLRDGLLSVPESTRGTTNGTQAHEIDIDRLARVIELLVQGLERFTEAGQLKTIGSGRFRPGPVPPSLPGMPPPFVGRTDSMRIAY